MRDHRRTPKLQIIPVKELKNQDDFQIDPIFQKNYQNSVLGKITTGLTRISSDQIEGGFYRRTGDDVELISQTTERGTKMLAEIIQRGGRPLVFTYWSDLSGKGGKFVCPDDENTLAPYRVLGIQDIPVCVLKPTNSNNSEAILKFRSRNLKHEYVGFYKSNINLVRSFGTDKFDEISKQLDFLIKCCDESRGRIVSFHLSGGEIDHHAILFAQVYRFKRILISIKNLISIGNVDHMP